MEKYLGIVKVVSESMIGVDIKILTKFSDDKSYIEKWFELYPDSEKIILQNNYELKSFFGDLEDFSPVTESERKEARRAYEQFKKDL